MMRMVHHVEVNSAVFASMATWANHQDLLPGLTSFGMMSTNSRKLPGQPWMRSSGMALGLSDR